MIILNTYHWHGSGHPLVRPSTKYVYLYVCYKPLYIAKSIELAYPSNLKGKLYIYNGLFQQLKDINRDNVL